MRRTVLAVVLPVTVLGSLTFAGATALAKGTVNDFPTEVRAEYVFACMASTRQEPEFLRKCSCAVDTIASRLSYEEYQEAETVLRLRLSNSPDAEVYKNSESTNAALDRLLRAQAAAQLKCF